MDNLFKEPQEKGSQEWFRMGEKPAGPILPLLIMVIAGLIIVAAFVLDNNLQKRNSTEITEKDGVLYYPDGSPVRNYEQLSRYLGKEVK